MRVDGSVSLLYAFKPEKDRALDPVCRALWSAGITPNMVTAAGPLASVLAGLLAASGHLYTGIIIFSIGACLDAVDGSLARISGRSSEFGRYFDSVSDRVSEGVFIAGAVIGGVPAAALAVIAGSVLLLASRIYNHRRGLGSDAALFGRPERLALLIAGMLLPSPANVVVFVTNALLCVVSSYRVLASGAAAPQEG
jgi:phosphatidylglycerophosphate synthase